MSPEAELQLAKEIGAIGKTPFIKQFLGFSPRELPPSKDSFFETHAAGLVYLGLIIAGFMFLDWHATPIKKGSDDNALILFVSIGWLGAIIFYGSMLVVAGRYATWLTSIESKYRISLKQAPLPQNFPIDDNAFYEVVAGEIEQGQIDKVIWTRAIANSAGDDSLAKSLYVRYRVQVLQEASRAEHEAQILAQEHQRRQAEEAAAREQAENNKTGCGIALLVVIGIFIIGIFILMGVCNPLLDVPSNPSSTYTASTAPQPTPSPAAQIIILERKFTELDAEYRALSVRRVKLDANDPEQFAAFNRDAADYTIRIQKAHAMQSQLDQSTK